MPVTPVKATVSYTKDCVLHKHYHPRQRGNEQCATKGSDLSSTQCLQAKMATLEKGSTNATMQEALGGLSAYWPSRLGTGPSRDVAITSEICEPRSSNAPRKVAGLTSPHSQPVTRSTELFRLAAARTGPADAAER